MSNSNLYLILLCIIVVLFLSAIIIPICITIIKHNKYKVLLTNKLSDVLTRYKRIQLNMNENEMLTIMNFRHDKSMTTEFTTYRYVYINKGGSGETRGYMGTSYFNNHQYINGSIYGSSESHDESVVIIKCVNGKVTEVNPYNMSSIQIPTSYNELIDLANLIGITI